MGSEIDSIPHVSRLREVDNSRHLIPGYWIIRVDRFRAHGDLVTRAPSDSYVHQAKFIAANIFAGLARDLNSA